MIHWEKVNSFYSRCFFTKKIPLLDSKKVKKILISTEPHLTELMLPIMDFVLLILP